MEFDAFLDFTAEIFNLTSFDSISNKVTNGEILILSSQGKSSSMETTDKPPKQEVNIV